MPSQHPSLTKTSLAITTLRATPPPSVRSSLKPPAPPTTADSQPPRKETGLDLALSYAHPGAAGIKMASIARAHMPGELISKTVLAVQHSAIKKAWGRKKKVSTTPQQPKLRFGDACNRDRAQVRRPGRGPHQQLSTGQSQTGTRLLPKKRCSCFHCTLVRPGRPCSHDFLRTHPSSAKPHHILRTDFVL